MRKITSFYLLMIIFTWCFTMTSAAQDSIMVQPANMQPVKQFGLEDKRIKKGKITQIKVDMRYALPAPALERFCNKFFFKDTISSTLQEAFEAYSTTLGNAYHAYKEPNATHSFTMFPGACREGYYYCYTLKYSKEADGKRRFNERNIIYDATTDRVLTIEDILSPDVASQLRNDAGNAFVHLKAEDMNISMQYKKDKKMYEQRATPYTEPQKFTPHFLALFKRSPEELEKLEKKIFEVVEQMPEFPGGQAAFINYIFNNAKYPTEAEKKGIQGVTCTFVVEKDGSITDIQVVRSIEPSLDREAVRVLEKMPKWIPGKQGGNTVRVKYTASVIFRPEPKKEEAFDVVERMPEFPGGQAALIKWISNNLNYPAIAEKKGIQGRVVCEFLVEKDGSITDIMVVRSIHPLLDEEALRILTKMPKWNPGTLNGVPLRVKYVLPITFKLK